MRDLKSIQIKYEQCYTSILLNNLLLKILPHLSSQFKAFSNKKEIKLIQIEAVTKERSKSEAKLLDMYLCA